VIGPGDWLKNVIPTGDEVLWAVRRQRNLNEQFSQLQRAERAVTRGTDARQIDISNESEMIYLPCDFVIQTGSTDFRISDPFGYGLSELLEASYRKLIGESHDEEKFVLECKERATGVKANPKPEKDDVNERIVDMFGKAIWSFGELRFQLWKSEKNWHFTHETPSSYDQEQRLRSAKQETVGALCSAIEWALFYGLQQSHRSDIEDVLLAGDFRENRNILKGLATKIGFETDMCFKLLGVDAGQIRSVRFGSSNLKPLVALWLVAASGDSLHPLHRIANDGPGWLTFLQRLKDARDASSHGVDPNVSQDEIDVFRHGVHRSIPILLPILTTSLTNRDEPRLAESARAMLNRRFAVRVSLEKHFGVQQFALLDEQAAELFIQAEQHCIRFEEHYTGDVECGFLINTLASVSQMIVFDLVSANRQSSVDGSKISAPEAERRFRAASFHLVNDKLPPSLATVNPRMLTSVTQGISPSLGAVVLGAAVLLDESTLDKLGSTIPNMLLVAHRLLELRKHGNHRVPLPVAEMRVLKNDVFDICKHLLETT